MTTDTARDKFFDAINESYDALVSAVEAAEARGHNVSQVVLQEARKGEREVQEALERVIKANRAATDATVDALRNAFSRLRGAEEQAEPGRRRPTRLTNVPVAAKPDATESTG